MLPVSGVTRIYLYSKPCDMRKSFDGLCGLVRSELGADPLSGSLFVFCNRNRTMVKVLYWDMDGFVIWYKRLEEREDSGCRSYVVQVGLLIEESLGCCWKEWYLKRWKKDIFYPNNLLTYLVIYVYMLLWLKILQ